MKHTEISDDCLSRDRLFTDAAIAADQIPSEDRHSLIDLVSDGRAELLDTLLQILLMVCLFSSFVACGWKLGNMPGTGAPGRIVQQQQPTAATRQVTEVAVNPTVSHSRSKVALPHVTGPLTLSSKLF